MTLIVPTANVSFSLGSNTAPADLSMGKSLDDMIKDRRKEQVQASKRGPKKVDNADRAVATGRAKRAAAVNARRGLSETKKPTAMDVEKEVYREARKTAVSKERKQQKAAGGKLPPDSSSRRQKKKSPAGKQQPIAPAAAKGIRPSKKAIKAAVSAMQEKGFNVPNGMQVVFSLAPTEGAADGKKTPQKKTPAQGTKKGKGNGNDSDNQKPNNNNTNNKNGGGRRKK